MEPILTSMICKLLSPHCKNCFLFSQKILMFYIQDPNIYFEKKMRIVLEKYDG